MMGKVTQQPPQVIKPQENQVQETESKEEDEAVFAEEAVTKDVEDYVGDSTYHRTEGYGRFNGVPIYGHL